MLLIEVHKWRSVGIDKDLFLFHLRLGVLSIAWDLKRVSDRMREMKGVIGAVSAGMRDAREFLANIGR